MMFFIMRLTRLIAEESLLVKLDILHVVSLLPFDTIRGTNSKILYYLYQQKSPQKTDLLLSEGE